MLTCITEVKVPATALFSAGIPDLVDLAPIKLELQITTSTDDAWMASVLTRTSQAVSDYCHRVFQPQTYQDQFWPQRDHWPDQLPCGIQPLQLSGWPLTAAICPAGIAPPQVPWLSYVSGGTLAQAIYWVRITYVTNQGDETACSLEARQGVPANNLLTVSTPSADTQGIAIGWNCYISSGASGSFGETLQNSVPIDFQTSFTMASTGLVAGASVPNYITVVENSAKSIAPVTAPLNISNQSSSLAEGVDFIANQKNGQLSRLFPDGCEREWPALPIIVQYQAGFSTIPSDLQDAAIRLVAFRWHSRGRDPSVKQENIPGAYQAEYWYGTGPGAPFDMPADIAAMLARNYRVPIIGGA